MWKSLKWSAIVCMVVLAGATSVPAAVKSIRVLKQSGGRLDWSKTRDLIAYDRMSANRYFNIWVMRPDGSGDECLTCGKPALPGRHAGNPSWHPNGEWIAFQAQKDVAPLGAISDAVANPGAGLNNDVWIMDSRGERFWRITDVQVTRGGVLHPHFSPDGTKIAWAERVASTPGRYGSWVIRIGEFSVSSGTPVILNIRTFRPGSPRTTFYETHGFTPDSASLVFSGNLEGQDELFLDIYRLNVQSGEFTNLTESGDDWDEHAQLSPSGASLIWMSSRGVRKPTAPLEVSTDYWIMNIDGSAKQRLTYFNDASSGEFIRGGAIAADSSWSPTADRLAAYLILDPSTVTGIIVMVEFDWTVSTVSSARYTRPVAPGAIASVFGRGLASRTVSATTTALPTRLDQTQVRITDSRNVTREAPLFFVTPGQVNYLVPAETAAGSARIQVVVNGIIAGSEEINVQSVAPGLYTANQDGRGVPAAYIQRVRAGGGQTLTDVFVCDASGRNCNAAPVDLTDGSVYLQLFGTGIRGRSSLNAVTVTVRGTTLPVLFAGPHAVYPGLDQIAVELPRSLIGAGDTEVVVNVDGTTSNPVVLRFR